jgi:C4-dicarboxylate transporter, DctQ subunit
LLKELFILFDRALDFFAVLASILLAFTTLSVSAGIFSRYFLFYPLAWVTEVNEYVIIYITFLIAAWVLREERHVKMELVISRLDGKARSKINFATSILCAIGCLVVGWYGMKVTWELYKTHTFTYTVLELPKCAFTFPISFGSLLLFVQFLRRAYGFLQGDQSSKEQNGIK